MVLAPVGRRLAPRLERRIRLTQHQDGLGCRPQQRGQRRCTITDVVADRDVHEAAPQLWLLGADDSGESPQAALAQRRVGDGVPHPASDDPQPGGWRSSRLASRQTRSVTSPDRRTEQSMSDSPECSGPDRQRRRRVGRHQRRRRVAGVQSRARRVLATSLCPSTATLQPGVRWRLRLRMPGPRLPFDRVGQVSESASRGAA